MTADEAAELIRNAVAAKRAAESNAGKAQPRKQ